MVGGGGVYDKVRAEGNGYQGHGYKGRVYIEGYH